MRLLAVLLVFLIAGCASVPRMDRDDTNCDPDIVDVKLWLKRQYHLPALKDQR